MEITPQDFLALTKGSEYLISVAFLLGFVWFWSYLSSKPKKQD